VAWFLVAFGAVFEMPVVVIAAVRMGVVKTSFLRKHWRYAIVINAIIAMVATPSQDAFSFIAMFIPLEILYEISLLVARVIERRRPAVQTETAHDDEGRPLLPPDVCCRAPGGQTASANGAPDGRQHGGAVSRYTRMTP